VLDAQNFGVAQRRRRVFVVGHLGDWKPAAEVLFESESLCWDTKKGRETKKNIANCLTKSPSSYSSYNPARGEGNAVVTQIAYENHPSDSRVKEMGEVCSTVTKQWGTGGGNVPFVQKFTYALQGAGATSQNANGSGYKEEQSYTLNVTDVHGVAQFVDTYNGTIQGNVCATMTADMAGPTHSGPKVMVQNIVAPTLTASNDPSRSPQSTEITNQVAAVYATSMAVRRLTPVECERLQGFPDNYTNIPKAADGNRYKALGNSMAVPVMNWIGKRINQINER
jgi:DNA (cytosine-5)-methyltransferase 1